MTYYVTRCRRDETPVGGQFHPGFDEIGDDGQPTGRILLPDARYPYTDRDFITDPLLLVEAGEMGVGHPSSYREPAPDFDAPMKIVPDDPDEAETRAPPPLDIASRVAHAVGTVLSEAARETREILGLDAEEGLEDDTPASTRRTVESAEATRRMVENAAVTIGVQNFYLCFDWHYGSERVAVESVAAAVAYRAQLEEFYRGELSSTMTNWRIIEQLVVRETELPWP